MGIDGAWDVIGTVFPKCIEKRPLDSLKRCTLQIVDCLGILNELKFGVGHPTIRALAMSILSRIMFPFTCGVGDEAWGAAVEAGIPAGLILLFDNAKYTSRAKEATQKDRSTRAGGTKPPRVPPAAFNPDQTLDSPLGNWGPNWYDKRENRPHLQKLLRRALVEQFATAASVGWAPSLEMWLIDGSGRPPVSVRWSREMNIAGLRVSAPVGADGRGVLPADVAVAAAAETAVSEVDAVFTAVASDVGEADYMVLYALRRWCELRIDKPNTELCVMYRAKDTDWTLTTLVMMAISLDPSFLSGVPSGTKLKVYQLCDTLNASYKTSEPTRIMDITKAFRIACSILPNEAPELGIPPTISAITCAWFLRGGGDDYTGRLRMPGEPGAGPRRLTCGRGKDLLGAYISWLRQAAPVYMLRARREAAASGVSIATVRDRVRKRVEVIRIIRREPLALTLEGLRRPHAEWTVHHREGVLADMLAGTFLSGVVTESYVSASGVKEMRKIGKAALATIAAGGASTAGNVRATSAMRLWARNLNFSITHCLRSMFDGLELYGAMRKGAAPNCLELGTDGTPVWGFVVSEETGIVVSSLTPVRAPGGRSGAHGSPERRMAVGAAGFPKPRPSPPPKPPVTPVTVRKKKTVAFKDSAKRKPAARKLKAPVKVRPPSKGKRQSDEDADVGPGKRRATKAKVVRRPPTKKPLKLAPT